MSKPSVLEIVQEVMNDLDGDFINSIDDTEESQQVASILASTYRAMMSNRNWAHTNRTVKLVPSGDNDLPTHMTLQDQIKELISVYYDKRKNGETAIQMREVIYKDPDDFLRLTFARNSDDADTRVITDPSGVQFLILNDKAPEYYTSFDDNVLVFDSYDSTVDSTLQASKILVRAFIMPTLILANNTIPDLPEEAFTLLIEETKSKASYKLKQAEDVKSEQESARQNRWLSRKNWRVHGGVKYPNYGRSRSRHTDPTFKRDN